MWKDFHDGKLGFYATYDWKNIKVFFLKGQTDILGQLYKTITWENL